MSRTVNTDPYEIQVYGRDLPGVVYHRHRQRVSHQKPDGSWIYREVPADCDYSPHNGPVELRLRQSGGRRSERLSCGRSVVYLGGANSFGRNAKDYRRQLRRRIRRQTNDTLRLMAREGADTELEVTPSRLTRRQVAWMMS